MTWNYHRSFRNDSDHAKPVHITQNLCKSHGTRKLAQITQNHHRSRRTPTTVALSDRMNSINWPKKISLLKSISANLNVSKIFTRVTYFRVKFGQITLWWCCRVHATHRSRVKSGRMRSDHTEPSQISQNRYRSCRSYSNHAEPSQITQNLLRPHRTTTDHSKQAQITHNNHSSRRTSSDPAEISQSTQKPLKSNKLL